MCKDRPVGGLVADRQALARTRRTALYGYPQCRRPGCWRCRSRRRAAHPARPARTACRHWDRGRAPWPRCRPAPARCPKAHRACACDAPRRSRCRTPPATLRAAMRTSSCATATPMEVLGATSTAMSRDAAAMRASNSAPCPVVPMTMGTRAARQTLSARRLRSGREKSMATWAFARSGGSSSSDAHAERLHARDFADVAVPCDLLPAMPPPRRPRAFCPRRSRARFTNDGRAHASGGADQCCCRHMCSLSRLAPTVCRSAAQSCETAAP